jgi:hypothetical protein
MGCQTFKQMWNGDDSVVKSATWACFNQTYSGQTIDWDEVFLLRDGVSVFEIHHFTDGVERLSSEAQAEYFRDGIAHWKPENSSTSLDVTKSNETLIIDLRYTDTENANRHFHFNMRLSSGRFISVWTIERRSLTHSTTTTEDYAGQCILLPKPTK